MYFSVGSLCTRIVLSATSLTHVQPLSHKHTCTISSHYRLTNWYNIRRGQCVGLWKEKQTPWPQKLQSWAPPLILHRSQNRGCAYQICFASLRTPLNSTFSGSPAFNESFAPVFLYQDSRKVRHHRAIQLDNDIVNTRKYYFSVAFLVGNHRWSNSRAHPLHISQCRVYCVTVCVL